ncbi:RNA polymerase sigma factor [Mangrovivirga cuniculi]|uniref:RNA polymerase subunit sigma-70 n=1 Tax=Mangrovivirga cuniculi TaxID=2715131 RepID=A0A4D7JEJ0_9BACT|nr:sigma-70 family RNA polymerase sigma factor [Mangrovivirga cuniculi]QCK14091.1 RNA polymerase subunit sigma-70 [Mangrovivirga cuniculi]
MRLKISHNDSLEQIVLDCKKQKRNAQKELYDRYSGRMHAICRRYISDSLEAEGVMVKGFMKIFEKIDQYEFQGSFEGWMRKIMVNEALMYLRKNKNMWPESDLNAASNVQDYNSLSNSLEAEDLLKLIDKLPQGYRTVFSLYAIDGFSHKEIAEKLNISENTSKSQLSRARSQLQKMLSYEEERINKNLKEDHHG